MNEHPQKQISHEYIPISLIAIVRILRAPQMNGIILASN